MGKYHVGQVIGQRTIIELLPTQGAKRRRWCRARCVCGREQQIEARSLRRAESCGCFNRPQPGEVFGVRTVVESNPITVRVRCICGQEQRIRYFNLRHTYSCGCVKAPPDAERTRLFREEQRTRRTDTRRYLLDLVRKLKAVREGELECTLTATDIEVPAVCPERGVPLKRGGRMTADSPSVVRVDPSLGYVPGNVRVISREAAQELKRQRLAEEKAQKAVEEKAQKAAAEEALEAERREKLIKKFARELERPVYGMRVADLPCSIRLDRALQRLKIVTIMDLLLFEPDHFFEQPNVGRKTVGELRSHMEGLGVAWPNPVRSWLVSG